jgi:hypothetical protein
MLGGAGSFARRAGPGRNSSIADGNAAQRLDFLSI